MAQLIFKSRLCSACFTHIVPCLCDACIPYKSQSNHQAIAAMVQLIFIRISEQYYAISAISPLSSRLKPNHQAAAIAQWTHVRDSRGPPSSTCLCQMIFRFSPSNQAITDTRDPWRRQSGWQCRLNVYV